MPIGLFMVNPIILVNLGAEMIYIIDQRLRAQSISPEKSVVVLNDLITTLFSHQFQPTLFKPSKTFSQNFTRKLFDQIAHCSIMKLNETSMGKLYDLMTMSFKRQVIQASSGHELYHIAMQHFEGVAKVVSVEQVPSCLSACKETFIKTYQKFNTYDYMMIRSELLKYLQGKQIRVQLFLINHWQNQDGTFALSNNRMGGIGVKTPGDVIMYEADGSIKSRMIVNVKSSKDFIENTNKYFYEGIQTDLGNNLYVTQQSQESRIASKLKPGSGFQQTVSRGITQDYQGDQAKQELNDLASLIKGKSQDNKESYSLNILRQRPKSNSLSQPIDDTLDDMIIIDQTSKSSTVKQNIEKLFGELTITPKQVQHGDPEEEEEEDDLLAMMDKAAKK